MKTLSLTEGLPFINHMAARPCPICKESRYTPLYIQRFGGGISHRIVSCSACGFVYVKEVPTAREYAKHYSEESIYEFTRDEDIHEASYALLSSHIKKTDRILDIGCSTGNLLGLFRNNGYTRLLGIDPSPNCKLYARREFGVAVETATLESFRLKQRFDLIILSNVLEHLPDVQKSIRIIGSMLSDKGMVYVAVPDVHNFYRHVKEPFYEFSLEHINFFSDKTLQYAMSGFTPVFVKSRNAEIYSLWKRYSGSQLSIVQYVKKSSEVTKKLDAFFHTLPERYFSWGAGSLARRLTATTDLRPALFIDRNPALVGKKVLHIPIIPPEHIPDPQTPILIVSYRYRDEIYREIKRGCKNPILLLP